MRSSFLVAGIWLSGAVALAGGCGDDTGTGGNASTGTASPTAATTTAGPTSGTGGSAATCGTCTASACTAEITACQADAECATWLTCKNACDTAADAKTCLDACDLAASGVAAFNAIYACNCTKCSSECAAEDACTRKCEDAAPVLAPGEVPNDLSLTGLYVGQGADAQIASWAQPYEPKYKLWSDGAEKRRWVYIPGCKQIDTSDMDHWNFPVGTRFWKEFTRDGVRVETRLLYRFGDGDTDWKFATYKWNLDAPDDPSQALSLTGGEENANGTQHDIPNAPADCLNCHGKLKERVLGFGAIELTHDAIPGSLDIHQLSDAGILTVAAPAAGFPVPDDGTGVVSDALGYLHANCGGCHNENMAVPANFHMRLSVLETTPEATGAYTTALNVVTTNYKVGQGYYRIAGNDASHSAIIERIHESSMPPIASEIPDSAGEDIIKAWDDTLPAP